MKDSETGSDSVMTLDDACEFIVDCLHKTAPLQSTGYASIRTPNVGRGRLILDGVNRVSEQVYEEWTRRAVPEPGDLILAREAPAGNVAVIKDGQTVCLGQRTVHLRPDQDKADSDFLCYYLLAPRQQGLLLAGETGATAGHVNMRDIRRLDIGCLPDLDTQKTLGQTLATYDDLIENNRRRIALLEEAARLLFHEWFMHFRFPGHEHVKIIDGLPQGWVRKELGKLANISKGKNITRKSVEDGDVPVVAGGMKPAYYHNVANARAPVVTVSASGANAGYVALYLKDIWASDCSYMTIDENPHIWFWYLTFKCRQAEITSMQQGAAQPHVYPSHLRRMQIVMPPPELLEEFQEIVGRFFALVRNLQVQVDRLASARDLLLPRLMNGEIAV